MVRRTLVFGSAFLGLILILRLTSGAITSQSADGSAAPVPVPVVTPAFDCEENSPMPQTFVDSWSAEFEPKNFNATVIDLVEGCTYSIGNGEATFPTASTGKIIVATRVLEMVAAGTLDFATVSNDMELMITESNNRSANRLFRAIGENVGISSVVKDYSLTATSSGRTWGTIQTTSSDQALLLEQVLGAKDSPLPELQRVILRDLMKRVVPQQAWGAGSAGGIPAQWSAGVKNGWYLSVAGDQSPVGLWRINTTGLVWDQIETPRWIFTGYSDTWPTEEKGKMAWSAITKQLSKTLGVR